MSQAVKHPQHSVLIRFTHKTARQESSKFYCDLRNASSLALTKYYCINCHCSAVTMPIKLSSYVTWSTRETVASVQLPLNTVFFCLAEVVSCDFVTSMQPLYTASTFSPTRVHQHNAQTLPSTGFNIIQTALSQTSSFGVMASNIWSSATLLKLGL